MSLFVDSSAFYAAADADDVSNERMKELLAREKSLVTTDHVLGETWILLRHRLGRQAAETFWYGVREGAASLEIVREGDLELAWAIGEQFPDQDFSFVDRTSFAVMQRIGVHRAATLDDDFAVFRFGRDRRRAFEILR